MISQTILIAFLAFLSLFTSASGAEPMNLVAEQQSGLRGPTTRYEEDADRNALFFCNIVEGLFPTVNGGVNCTCSNRWLFGDISFDCSTTTVACKPLPLTGEYCSKTQVKGKVNWFFFQLKSSLTVEGCETSVVAKNTLAGDVAIGKVCLSLGVVGRLIGDTGISSCGSVFGDVTCASCASCKYDVPATNRTGVSLSCNNLAVKPCFPFEVPFFVAGREAEQESPIDTLKKFVDPSGIVGGPAMDYTVLKVQEAIAAMNA
jgi:hypothetical protein